MQQTIASSFVTIAAATIFFFSISFRLFFSHGQHDHHDGSRKLTIGQWDSSAIIPGTGIESSGSNSGDSRANSYVGNTYNLEKIMSTDYDLVMDEMLDIVSSLSSSSSSLILFK